MVIKNNIIEFPNKFNSESNETSPVPKIVEEREVEGADAWNRLLSSKNEKLSWDDRIGIATEIDNEIVKLDIVRIVQYAQTGIIRLFYL